MRLVVGLGNPGKKYMHTRHNVGFRVLDNLATDWQLMAKYSALIHKSGDTIYAKPQTFMNLSGAAVQALMTYYKIPIEDLIVVYDDKDLPLGTVRERDTGSSAGHNGMNSIIGVLGTQDIARIKIGVAPTDPETIIHDTADYVLSNFTADEEQALPEIIEQAVQAIHRP